MNNQLETLRSDVCVLPHGQRLDVGVGQLDPLGSVQGGLLDQPHEGGVALGQHPPGRPGPSADLRPAPDDRPVPRNTTIKSSRSTSGGRAADRAMIQSPMIE